MQDALWVVGERNVRHAVLAAVQHGQLAALIRAVDADAARIMPRYQEIMGAVEVN